jgi:hypothetical protein
MRAETGPSISERDPVGGAAGRFPHAGAAVPLLGQTPPVAQPRFAASEWQASCPDGTALNVAP